MQFRLVHQGDGLRGRIAYLQIISMHDERTPRGNSLDHLCSPKGRHHFGYGYSEKLFANPKTTILLIDDNEKDRTY